MLEAERLYDDTLMKPIDLRQLLKKIHALVDIEWLYTNDAPAPDAPPTAPQMTAKLPAGCDIDELIQLGEIGHVTRILERLSEIESGAIHSAKRSADSATNRREAADFDVPSPVTAWRSPSGSRTARLSLRVDTLISIRFIAQRPSQSSA
jgi:hypothetical protein